MKLLLFFTACFNCCFLVAQNSQVHDLILSAMKKDSLGNYSEALMDVEKAIELSKHPQNPKTPYNGGIIENQNKM